MGLEFREDLRLASGSDYACLGLAVLEQQKRWDTHHLEPLRSAGIVVDVQLGHL
jgi:hypothetical protein